MNLKMPPQKEKTAFPKSHQVINKAETNSRRFCLIITVNRDAILIQQPKIIAKTGNYRNIRFASINQSWSPDAQAKLINASWKNNGNKSIERIKFTIPLVPLNIIWLSILLIYTQLKELICRKYAGKIK